LLQIRAAPRKSAVSLPFNFGNYPILAISAISFAALSLRPSARTPPGGRSFVANKRRSAIRQPYDSLVEGNFLSSSGFVLVDF
jgi:hypothetical protein